MRNNITNLLLSNNFNSTQIGIIIGAVVLAIIAGIIIGFFVGFIGRKLLFKKQEQQLLNDISFKEKEAQKLMQLSKDEAKIEINKMKRELFLEVNYQKDKNDSFEKLLTKRETKLSEREEIIEKQTQNLYFQREAIKNTKLEYHQKIDQIIVELEKISGMSRNEAKTALFSKLEEKLALEFNKVVKNHEYNVKFQAKAISNNIISEAIERYASSFVVDKSVSYVKLPNEEMKGRVIGKEGRNIKSFELTAGVDIIIDDTPETIQISSFNPIRREIATRALEDLVKDGRIHPIRIEEIIKFHEQELSESFKVDGKKVIDELKLVDFDPELVSYIGKLKYRTSYGQNVLLHSFEVAKLAGTMAAELGLDVNIAKRAGLLHDIGKAADYELEGSHVYNGVLLAKKYGESDIVINAIHAHHGDVPKDNVYSCLVSAADTLSAARPGARNNSLEEFVTRIKEIEDLCKSIAGVEKAYAVQAGRQIRVIVNPNIINDFDVQNLARTLREKLEKMITIPGDIHITVIREVRVTELIN